MNEHVSKYKFFNFRLFIHVLISDVVKVKSIREGSPGDVYFLGGQQPDGG